MNQDEDEQARLRAMLSDAVRAQKDAEERAAWGNAGGWYLLVTFVVVLVLVVVARG